MALVPTRSATAATWASFTGTLTNGEVTLESDTGVVKVGDGITSYAKLGVSDNQITSATKAAGVSDETGTGAQVYGTNPTISGLVVSGWIVHTFTNAITASATQTQVGGTALTNKINRVVTVASAGNAVTLPAATAGREVVVIDSHATNAIGVFPASGDAINAIAANGVYSLASTKTAMFFCAVAGTWNTILSA